MIRTSYDAPGTLAPDQWRSAAACLGLWEAMHPDNNEDKSPPPKPSALAVRSVWSASGMRSVPATTSTGSGRDCGRTSGATC